MYYIPSAPIPETSQKPSLLRVYSYGAFLCDRTLSLLSQSAPTSYFADILPRLTVATLSESDRCISRLFVRLDHFDESLDSSKFCLNSAPEGGECLLPAPSWGNLCVKSGDDSLLVRMGLVPSISHDSVADDATPDEDLEVEVFRNTSFDATVWHEAQLQIQSEGSQNISCGELSLSEPRLDTESWLSPCAFSFPKHLSLIPQMLLGGTSLLTSSSSFFGGIRASSSSPNIFENDLPCAASPSYAIDNAQIEEEQMADQDSNYDIAFKLSSVIALDDQFSFEMDIPQLPSPSDAAAFVAESFVLPVTEETNRESISQIIKISPDAEELSGSSSHTNVMSLMSITAAQSFVMPTFASMESLIHISLEISDLSSSSSFSSSCSLCQLPLCASSDDLVRIQPPTWCEGEDDGDAFDPLPLGTASPFSLPSWLGPFRNFIDVKYMYPLLPSLKEEDS